jgi:hypothetical protein
VKKKTEEDAKKVGVKAVEEAKIAGKDAKKVGGKVVEETEKVAGKVKKKL